MVNKKGQGWFTLELYTEYNDKEQIPEIEVEIETSHSLKIDINNTSIYCVEVNREHNEPSQSVIECNINNDCTIEIELGKV